MQARSPPHWPIEALRHSDSATEAAHSLTAWTALSIWGRYRPQLLHGLSGKCCCSCLTMQLTMISADLELLARFLIPAMFAHPTCLPSQQIVIPPDSLVVNGTRKRPSAVAWAQHRTSGGRRKPDGQRPRRSV